MRWIARQLVPTGLFLTRLFLMGSCSALLAGSPAQAQPAYRVADVNTTRTGGTDDSASRTQFVDLNGTILFAAADGRRGTELWRTNGTAEGTALVKDICPGVCPSEPMYLTVVGSQVFFAANDGAHGFELWKTDGTAAGTVRMADLVPSLAGPPPGEMHELGGKLLFVPQGTAALDGELWVTDGTAAGTALVADIEPGPGGSLPYFLGRIGGVVLFSAWTSAHGRELWRTDGTAAGTFEVMDIHPGLPDSLFAAHLYPFTPWAAVSAGKLFFAADDGVHGSELWVSDGTAAGTALVKDINPTSAGAGSTPYDLVPFGNGVVFGADDGVNGNEVWISDGTAAGTVLVKDVNPGSGRAAPRDITVVGSRVFFSADDGTNGRELWATDGTAAGTVLVKDIQPGSGSGVQFGLSEFTAVGSKLLFFADDGVHGEELWASDGTAAGTALLVDINPGSAPSYYAGGFFAGDQPVVSAGRMFFRASTDASGIEVWVSDGTAGGTHPIEINDQASAFLITYPGEIFGGPVLGPLPGGGVLFGADDGVSGNEPWATDGTAPGTHRVADLWPGAVGSFPRGMTPVGGSVLFRAETSPTSSGLWASNGTAAGTVFLTAASDPAYATPLGSGNTVLFAGPSSALWKTDGTAAGTGPIGPIGPVGSAPLLFDGPAPLGSSLLFSGDVPLGGQSGLWKTDGTAAGTGLVKGFPRLPNGPVMGPLFPATGRVFFSVLAATGRELWVSDGTAAGTVQIKDIQPGPGDGIPVPFVPDRVNGPFPMAALGSSVVFVADDGVHGQEPWVSDGGVSGAGGTILLADIVPGAGTSSPQWFTSAAGRVFFVADDGVHGRELWVTDGGASGAAGTVLLDLEPGAGSSLPDHLRAVGRVLLFSAWDSVHGLWVSDGTAAGTSRLQDIAPGDLSSSPMQITPSGPTVYFVANDNTTGFEIWALPRTALGAALTAVMTAAGGFYEGGTVTYRIVITNNGRTLQPDAAGPELTDVLPSGLALTGATATMGTAGTVGVNPGTRTVTWNGSLAAGASMTVTITATVEAGTQGTTLSNQATLAWDGDADGVNEASGVSDDPAVVGGSNPTGVAVGPEVLGFYSVTPCRAVDTRSTSPLASGTTRTFPLAGSCGVPASARAVAVNLTVVSATGSGNAVLWRSGTAAPGTSSLNFPAGSPGATRSNNAVVGLAGGALDAKATVGGSGTVQLVIDVSGYFQ
jgi:uncharacterized repeat protein (TIGR01451 family)